MASIKYGWQGAAGLIVFPFGTGLDDEAEFTINGTLNMSDLVMELDEARMMNRGNLALPRTFAGAVSPRYVITALGILGWDCQPDEELTNAINQENAAPEPPADEETIF